MRQPQPSHWFRQNWRAFNHTQTLPTISGRSSQVSQWENSLLLSLSVWNCIREWDEWECFSFSAYLLDLTGQSVWLLKLSQNSDCCSPSQILSLIKRLKGMPVFLHEKFPKILWRKPLFFSLSLAENQWWSWNPELRAGWASSCHHSSLAWGCHHLPWAWQTLSSPALGSSSLDSVVALIPGQFCRHQSWSAQGSSKDGTDLMYLGCFAERNPRRLFFTFFLEI